MVNLGELVFSIVAEDKASTTVGTAAANIGKAGQTAGLAMTGIGVGAKVMADNINGTYVPFDKALQGIRSIGASAADVDKIKEASLGISSTMPVAAQDLVDSAYLIRSAGFESLDLTSSFGSGKNSLEALAQVAVAGGEDITGVTQTVITAMGAYGETAYSTADIAAVLANGVKLGKFEMGAFGAELQKNIGTAAGLGMSLETTAAANVILQNSFSSAEEAGTGLKSMLAALVDPKKVGDLEEMGVKVKDADGNFVGLQSVLEQLGPALEGMTGGTSETAADLQAMGISAFDSQGKFIGMDAVLKGLNKTFANPSVKSMQSAITAAGMSVKDASGAFLEGDALTAQYGDAMKKLGIVVNENTGTLELTGKAYEKFNTELSATGGSVEQQGALFEIFGSYGVRAAQGLLQNVDALGEYTATMGDTGAVQEMMNANLESTSAQLEIANNKAENAKISLGTAMAPATIAAAGAMGGLADIISGLPGPLQTAAGAALMGAQSFLGIGPAVAGAGTIMTTFSNQTVQKMIPGLGKVVTGITGAGGLIPAFMAIATGPVGIAIAAIVAIGAAIILLDKQFHFIGPTIEWFGEVFKGIGDWLGKTFGPIIDGVIGFFGELFGTVDSGKGPIETIIGLFASLGKWAAEVGSAIGEYLTPIIQGFATWIGQTLGPAIKGVIGFFGELWEELNKAGGVFERARDVIVAAWNVIASLFGGGDGNGVVAAIKGLWDAVLAYVPVAWGFIIQAVGSALVALGTWILTNGPPLVVAAMQAIWTAITVTIPAAWELIKSAVIEAAGLIWTWLSTEGVRLAGAAVLSIWTWIQNAIPAAWAAIQAAVVAAANAIWAWLTGEGKAGADTAVKSIWSTIAGAVPDAWKAIMAAVLAAARAIWSWLSGDGAAEAKSAIGSAWSAIAKAVPDAWKAITTAVKKAAQDAWDAAQRILKQPFTFELPDIVGAARRAYDAAASILSDTLPTPSPSYSPSNVVSDEKRYDSDGVQVGGNSPGSYYGDYIYSPDGHKIGRYIGGKATYYHSGGIAENEQLAVLLKNERVLSPAQTKEYDAGLLSAVQALAAKIDQLGGSGGGDVIVHGDVKLSEDYSYDRFREDVGRWKSSRIAKGMLS